MRAELEPLLLRVPDAARLAAVGRTTGYELVASGQWPSVRLGRRAVRVPLEGLRAWIERHTQTANDLTDPTGGEAA